jgi:hypothetical protein
VDHLKALSHVVEKIFLLPWSNVIWQALLDSWGGSNDLCMIYALLIVPLNSLQITYAGTSDI